MSKQIDRLMAKHPEICQMVSYEGNDKDKYGDPRGDGTWLYLHPSWYADQDCGTIHEYTIKEVLHVFHHNIEQDKQRWIDEHPEEPDEIANIRAGKYDRKES